MEERRTTIDDILQAKDLLKPIITRTPLHYSDILSTQLGCQLYLKLENLQKTGSYKIRGAYNNIATRIDQCSNGVITASAGNHAQGVAYTANAFGIQKGTIIFVPKGTPQIKQDSTRRYGGPDIEIKPVGENVDAARTEAYKTAQQENKPFIEPFDDWRTIAGQGTVGLEILEDLPDVDVIVVPVGGGGLIAGIAIAVQAHNKVNDRNVKVVGVEAERAACMLHALNEGEPKELPHPPKTMADGIKVRKAGDKPYKVIKGLYESGLLHLCTVEESEISTAVADLLINCKMVAEGAGAAGFAALNQTASEAAAERIAKLKEDAKKADTQIVVVNTGANINMNWLARIIFARRSTLGHYLNIRTTVPDTPGELLNLIQPISEKGINIIDVILSQGTDIPIDETMVELHLETKDVQQQAETKEELLRKGYPIH